MSHSNPVSPSNFHFHRRARRLPHSPRYSPLIPWTYASSEFLVLSLARRFGQIRFRGREIEVTECHLSYQAHYFSLEELLLRLGRSTRPKTLCSEGICRQLHLPLFTSSMKHVEAQFFCVYWLHAGSNRL